LVNDAVNEKNRMEWIQLSHLMDIIYLQTLMNENFDFKHYYNEFGKYEMKELVEKVKIRIKAL